MTKQIGNKKIRSATCFVVPDIATEDGICDVAVLSDLIYVKPVDMRLRTEEPTFQVEKGEELPYGLTIPSAQIVCALMERVYENRKDENSEGLRLCLKRAMNSFPGLATSTRYEGDPLELILADQKRLEDLDEPFCIDSQYVSQVEKLLGAKSYRIGRLMQYTMRKLESRITGAIASSSISHQLLEKTGRLESAVMRVRGDGNILLFDANVFQQVAQAWDNYSPSKYFGIKLL